MATVAIEIGKEGKNGKRRVSYLVTHNRRKKRISTSVYLSPTEVSSNGKKIKDVQKARMVQEMLRKLEDALAEMSLDLCGDEVTVEHVAERLTQRTADVEFFSFCADWLHTTAIKGKKNYETMLNSLASYVGKRHLPFHAITYQLLHGYEQHLRNKPRAQSMYLGAIRHLYREAMRRYNTDYEMVIKNDPFMRYKVPRQVMRKGVRALTLEEIKAIYDYVPAPGGRVQLARDCFILSFCLMGINSIDMYEVRTKKKDVLCYKRAKTKDRRSDEAYIETWVHPVIKPLLARYADTQRVFNFHRRYSTSADFNAALNVGLKQVGKDVGIDGLQFYQARHTFATLSRNLMKISKSDVDEALNHVGSMDIADVYIKKDFTIINENNFRLLDRVFGRRQ